SRRRHTRFSRDWSSDVCSSDLHTERDPAIGPFDHRGQADVITEDLVRGVPAFEIFERRSRKELDGLSRTRLIRAEVNDGNTFERSEERRVGKECSCWWSTW